MKIFDNLKDGMGFLKYVIPLLLVAVLAYWWMNKDQIATTEGDEMKISSDKTSSTNDENPLIKASPSTNSTDNTSPKSFSINSNGDVLNGNGAVVFASGSFEFDQKGNLIDRTSKRILLPAVSISRNLGDTLNALLSGLSNTSSTEDMKALFGDMIMKKSNRTSYALSNIAFNKEDHMISNFSKAEVMGLAGALKENINGKIEVQVYTNDGMNAKESNSLSDTRANVIRDMLVTLGVDKKQISAKGMGTEDAVKAKAGKVDIVIK